MINVHAIRGIRHTKTIEVEEFAEICNGSLWHWIPVAEADTVQSETEKNRALLQRILDVTLHVASRNLPFRAKTRAR